MVSDAPNSAILFCRKRNILLQGKCFAESEGREVLARPVTSFLYSKDKTSSKIVITKIFSQYKKLVIINDTVIDCDGRQVKR